MPDAKNPFETNGTLARVRRNKGLGAVTNKGIKLLLNGLSPLGVVHSLEGRAGFFEGSSIRRRDDGGKVEFLKRFANVGLSTVNHRMKVTGQ